MHMETDSESILLVSRLLSQVCLAIFLWRARLLIHKGIYQFHLKGFLSHYRKKKLSLHLPNSE